MLYGTFERICLSVTREPAASEPWKAVALHSVILHCCNCMIAFAHASDAS